MARRNVIQALLIGAAALGWGTKSYAQPICAPALPQDICTLESKIYTGTDFKNTEDVRSVMVGLKNLFMAHVNDSEVIQDHLIGLTEHVLEEAHQVRAPRDILRDAAGKPNLIGIYDRLQRYQSQEGQIVPLDWEMPSEVMYFVFSTTKGYNPVLDRTVFDFSIFSILKAENAVEQVQVIRYPNEVVLDRQAGIGNWNESHTPGALPSFGLGTSDASSPQKQGLYLLNIKMKNKPMVKGWFVLSRNVPTANVVIRSPAPSQVFHTGNPTFRWVDYKSPEYKPFNQQKRKLSVYGRGSDNQGRAWSSAVVYPDGAESVTLADAPNIEGSSELKDGQYAFKTTFEERWFFGGLLIGRQATTEVPFTVAK